MSLSSISWAQTVNDPFAPTTIAPSLPTAAPTAPVPVAPKLPPRAPQSVQTKPVEVKPVATPITIPETVQEPPEKTTRPAPTPKTNIKPTSQPVAKAPAQTVETSRPYHAPANPNEPNPFAPTSVAPNLPNALPQTPYPAPLYVKEPDQKPETVVKAPKADTEKVTDKSHDKTELTTQEPKAKKTSFFEQLSDLFTPKKIPEATTKPPVAPAPEIVIPKEPATKQTETSFFDQLSDMFSPSEAKDQTQEAPQPIAEKPDTDALFDEILSQDKKEVAVETKPKPEEKLETQPLETTTSQAQPSEKLQKGLFDRLSDFFTPKDTPPAAAVEPSKQTTDIAPSTPTPAPVATVEKTPEIDEPTEETSEGLLERFKNMFDQAFGANEEVDTERHILVEPIKIKQKTPPEKVKPKQEPPKEPTITAKPVDPRLIKAQLGLGRDILLGQGDDDLSKNARCFTKNRGTVAFCVTPTRWPSDIAGHFNVSSHLYKGRQGIVQFDGSLATRLFTMFKTEGFDDIIAHYEEKLGPATTHFVRRTRTLKQGIIQNPTYVWRKENTDEGLVEVFEIRKISDMRGTLPDIQRGAIRAYFEGAREIFSLTSDLDYMKLR
ncbi:hypothetical protein [Terasakiella sp. SH-1]|uniref:hypothetical protein n=1 Tax=Terasakiella sp. SH-1 TaxID=2560057 RepID=UPI0010736BCC|nr:hypothetical protein [Terasakiella sp. SH-1]